MNRRRFLAYSASAVAMAGGFSLVNSMGQLQTVVRENTSSFIAGLEQELADIIDLAALAPSGHNAQPWTVTLLTSHHWIIGTDDTRWLPAVDPENREMMISIGAFLENLAMAANSKGYEVEIHIIAESAKSNEIAAVKLQKKEAVSDFSVKQITARRTLRSNILSEDLLNEDVMLLTQGGSEGCLYYARDSKEGKVLAEGTILANQIQGYREAAQMELADWIRWSNQDSRLYGNGLTPETMEIEGVSRWYVKNFYTRQSVLQEQFRQAAMQKSKEQATAGSGWLLLTGKAATVTELIRTGRKLQQIWLKVRERNIALHPMTQVLEEAATATALPSMLGTSDDIQMVLRVGYVHHYPHPVSLRMPLQRIII